MVKFLPYTSNEIEFILRSRVGDILADGASRLISQKVAQTSGDLRKALEYAAGAITEYRKSLSSMQMATLPETLSGLVTTKHAHRAMMNTREVLSDIIDGLPLTSKAVLCAMTALTQTGVRETSLEKLRRGISSCFINCQASDEIVSPEDFDFLVESLQGSGLLRIGRDNESLHDAKQTASTMDIPIVLGDSLGEVDKNIEELLLNQGYFRSIYDWITNNVALFEPRKLS
jgi:hypothetical protein